jgi:hypothetical protein
MSLSSNSLAASSVVPPFFSAGQQNAGAATVSAFQPATLPTPTVSGFQPAMPATPTVSGFQPAMPATPTVSGFQPATPATPTVSGFQPATPATPTPTVLGFQPATPTVSGFQPATPPTPTVSAFQPATPSPSGSLAGATTTSGASSPQFGPQTLQALFAMQAGATNSQSLMAQFNGAAGLADPTSDPTQGHHHHHAQQADAAAGNGSSGSTSGSTNTLMSQLLQIQAQLQTTAPQSIATA